MRLLLAPLLVVLALAVAADAQFIGGHPASSGSGGHTIQDEGSSLTARTNLNFTGVNVACTDDSGNDQTDCDVGVIGIAGGGTGQTTQTAAFDALAPTTGKGELTVHNGTDNVRMAACATGEFIRWNPNAADGDGIDCVTGPNFADQNADVVDSDNTSTTILTDITVTPEPDVWLGMDCTLVYETAATTTGITISVFANDGTSTAAPQFFTAKFTIGGFGAAGTDSDYVAHISAPSSAITTTGVVAANTPYVIKIDMLALGHATNSTTYAPMFRSEVNGSAVTIKEGSYCKGYVLHVDS